MSTHIAGLEIPVMRAMVRLRNYKHEEINSFVNSSKDLFSLYPFLSTFHCLGIV